MTVSLGQRPKVKRPPTTFLHDRPLEIEAAARRESPASRRRREDGGASPPEEEAAGGAQQAGRGPSAGEKTSPAAHAQTQDARSAERREERDRPGDDFSSSAVTQGAGTRLRQPDIPPEPESRPEPAEPHPAAPQVPPLEAYGDEDGDPASAEQEAEQSLGAGPAEPLAEAPPAGGIDSGRGPDPGREQDSDGQDSGHVPLQLELLERDLRPGRDKDQQGERQHSIVTFEERSQAEPSPLDRPLRGRGREEPDGSELWKAAFEPSGEEEEEEEAFGQGQTSAYADDFPDEDLEDADDLWVPREIFISRALAGLVDLILAAFTGLAFAAGASRVLGLSLLDPATPRMAGGMALLFLIVSSVFFLRLSGQTPGMHLAKLKALHQESPEIPTAAALIRVLAFLPSLGLLFAGLLWGLFDPWARCLHDRLSQTRVVAADRD